MKLRFHCTNAVILIAALGLAACGEHEPNMLKNEGTAEAVGSAESKLSTTTDRVLILARTVTGGFSSQEAVSAQQLGYLVDVVTDAQWAAKTAADFASYRAIILG